MLQRTARLCSTLARNCERHVPTLASRIGEVVLAVELLRLVLLPRAALRHLKSGPAYLEDPQTAEGVSLLLSEMVFLGQMMVVPGGVLLPLLQSLEI